MLYCVLFKNLLIHLISCTVVLFLGGLNARYTRSQIGYRCVWSRKWLTYMICNVKKLNKWRCHFTWEHTANPGILIMTTVVDQPATMPTVSQAPLGSCTAYIVHNNLASSLTVARSCKSLGLPVETEFSANNSVWFKQTTNCSPICV